MNKRLTLLSFLLLMLTVAALPQRSKPVIDTAALNRWPGFDEQLIVSSDGKYFSYGTTIGGKPSGIVVQSTEGNWRQEFRGPKQSMGIFSADGRQYVVSTAEGLCFVRLGTNEQKYEKMTGSFMQDRKTDPTWIAWKSSAGMVMLKNLVSNRSEQYAEVAQYSFDRSGRWFTCQLKNAARELLLYDLAKGREQRYSHAVSYTLSEDGRMLALQTKGEDGLLLLEWIDLVSSKRSFAWRGSNKNQVIGSVIFDDQSSQLLFTIPEDKAGNLSIWYYKAGLARAEQQANSKASGTEGLLVAGCSFSRGGRHILIDLLEPADDRQPDTKNKAKVDIWSWRDTLVQARQLYNNDPKQARYLGVLTEPGRVRRLQYRYDRILARGADFVILARDATGDRFWEPMHYRDSTWIVWLREGRRELLPVFVPSSSYGFYVSPGGRYVVWFDAAQGCNYFSYELSTGKILNLSSTLPAYLLAKESERNSDWKHLFDYGVAGWLEEDRGVLVYDDYDLWLLDPSGQRSPVNVTNGYGRRKGVRLWLAENNSTDVMHADASLLLTAFDRKSYYNGYYKTKLGSKGDPEELFIGPYCFDYGGSYLIVGDFLRLGGLDMFIQSYCHPVKAGKADVWMVRRQHATEAPNYFVTRDFKTYGALTDLQPQRSYNWRRAELVRFKQTDGQMSQGVLYKPEDFDSTKKYPVIINYYKSLSHLLYQYPQPEYMRSSNPDIGWFVSRGYLVFVPDIYGRNGQDEEGCLRSIEGAGQHLAGLSYVDSRRMGICGHSIGGAKTMYLVTHSKLFAAAFAGAAPRTDWVSHALGGLLRGQGSETVWQEALDQAESIRGVSLWEDPARWLKDNPVLLADKVTMPLLIYHGQRDDIPLSQPLEMYVALRRLNKPVWLLSYNESSHVTTNQRDAIDLTLRATQFFDHYLKGATPPRWMTEGIPARLKQIEDGLESNTSGRRP